MTLTNDQLSHGIKLLDRLILASNDTKQVLQTLDGKDSTIEELTKNEVVFMYLLFQLESIQKHEQVS